MNPLLKKKYGFNKTRISIPHHTKLVCWMAEISGMRVYIDNQFAGDDKYILQEIQNAKLLAASAAQRAGIAVAETCLEYVRFEADGDPNETVTFRCILKSGHKGRHMAKAEDCPDDPTWISGIHARKYNPPPAQIRSIYW